ncbi:MAG: DedA family protein [Rubellimicrobium sp.]|nr:DedA family protein [Rubellimicrobium sp.]
MFDWISGLIEVAGLAGVGFLMLAENVFPPIPSELIMPLAGYLAALGRMDPVLVVLVGTLGSVLGGLVWYELGRALGRERLLRLVARWGYLATISVAETEAALAWFARAGGWTVLAGRLVPMVRTLISIPAGLAGMGRGRFLALTAAGSAIWVSALTFAGWILEANYARVEGWLDPVTTVLLAAVVVTYVWRMLRMRARRPGDGGR